MVATALAMAPAMKNCRLVLAWLGLGLGLGLKVRG